MKNYVEEGEYLPFTTPGAGVVSGTPVRIGSLVVVPTVTVTAAQVTADATIKFTAMVCGVATVPKVTGGGTAWTEGAAIYWDNSATNFTKTVISDTNDHLVGTAVAAVGDSVATGAVRFDGVVR